MITWNTVRSPIVKLWPIDIEEAFPSPKRTAGWPLIPSVQYTGTPTTVAAAQAGHSPTSWPTTTSPPRQPSPVICRASSQMISPATSVGTGGPRTGQHQRRPLVQPVDDELAEVDGIDIGERRHPVSR